MLFGRGADARVLGVREIVLTVGDLEHSVAFYRDALGFREIERSESAASSMPTLTGVSAAPAGAVRLALGRETILLVQYAEQPRANTAKRGHALDLSFQHFAIVVRDMDRAFSNLATYPHEAISSAPQTIPAWNTAAAGIRAYKFLDPDGHPLELLWFPPGKGQPRWQDSGGDVFLGIDHSAIAVADTARSTAFYRDVIGLSVVGTGLNSGPTQEALDAVPGARVRITGLRSSDPSTPGVEFLEYLGPGVGRGSPEGHRADDPRHIRVVMEVDDLAATADALFDSHAGFVSPGAVALTGAWSRGLLVHDPDGHAVVLVQH